MTATPCTASLLLVAKDNAEALLAQLQSLVAAGLPDEVELIVVADGASPPVTEAIGMLSGRVKLLAGPAPVGRRAALASAAAAAESDVCVALGPLARPAPGFLEPLVAAVRGGAGLAAPVLETAEGRVHGYRLESDRSLRPRGPADDGPADALALDCLAARPELWQAAPRAFDHWRDLYEVSLANVARGFGPLAVVAASSVAREGLGPPLSVVTVEHGMDPEALDSAVATAPHELIVFVDSATRPAPGWAEHLAEAFLDPAVALARGPVRGLWPDGGDPNRFPLGTLDLLGIADRGDADVDLPPGREGGFPNVAVRRDALLAAGGFAAMAAAGSGALDAMLALHVRAQGGRCRYVSQAAVGTAIPAERASDPLLPYTLAFGAGAREQRIQAALGVSEPAVALGARLAHVAALPDALGADDLFERIVRGPGAAAERLDAARALGALAATGCAEARLASGAIVRFEPAHADGRVAISQDPQPCASAPRVSQPPLVSCVIPVFNVERYVGSAIQSVLDQDYPPDALDIVVIDDGSTDGTATECARFGERIRYVRQRNAGVIAAVDRGVREARGELIGFLDADDQWLPGKTRRQVEWMSAHPEVGLLYGDMELIDGDDRLIHSSFWGQQGVIPCRGQVFGNILRWNFVTTGSMLARASLRDAFCPMPAGSPWQDWGIATAIARVAAVDYLPEPTFRYRQHGENHALGAEGERLARAHEKDLRFRRAMYADVRQGELAPHDLRVLAHALLANADRLAQARSQARHEVLAISDGDRAAAAGMLADALAALAGGDLEHGLHLAFGAFVRNPLDEQALRVVEAAHERVARLRSGALPRPLDWPGDPDAAGRVLAGCAGTTVVAHVAELVADPGLLLSFASRFGAGEATLVAYSPDAGSEQVFDDLAAAVAAAGLDADGAPDIVLFDAPGSAELEQRLATRANWLLTGRAEASPLGALRALGGGLDQPGVHHAVPDRHHGHLEQPGR